MLCSVASQRMWESAVQSNGSFKTAFLPSDAFFHAILWEFANFSVFSLLNGKTAKQQSILNAQNAKKFLVYRDTRGNWL
jgi:hypothetical protein